MCSSLSRAVLQLVVIRKYNGVIMSDDVKVRVLVSFNGLKAGDEVNLNFGPALDRMLENNLIELIDADAPLIDTEEVEIGLEDIVPEDVDLDDDYHDDGEID